MNFHYALVPLCCVASAASHAPLDAPDGESAYENFQTDTALFRIAKDGWAVDGFGNHRALVQVDSPSTYSRVSLPWRRADLRQEEKKIIILAPDGKPVKNIKIVQQSSDSSTIIFDSGAGAGEYQIYYLPHKYRRKWGDARYGEPWNDYYPADYQASPEWTVGFERVEAQEAKLIAFESRTRFDYFTPMGLIATEAEVAKLREKYSQNPVVFPEDRAFPIRLRKQLPAKWGLEGEAKEDFTGHAARNEYYTWQLGLWAAQEELKGVKLVFSDFKSADASIPASEFTCFNQEGVDWDGSILDIPVNVSQDAVQALWCGVQIPRDAAAGCYEGTVTVTGKNFPSQRIAVKLNVGTDLLEDKGDGDLWRHSRLRWLNSQIGVDNKPVAPYADMSVKGNEILLSSKTLTLQDNGLIAQVTADGKKLLASPILFKLSSPTQSIAWSKPYLHITQQDTGLITWTSSSRAEGLELRCDARAEYDGYINFKLTLKSEQDIELSNAELAVNYSPYASSYFMGLGYSGGATPKSHVWKWDGPSDSCWTGGEKLGAHLELRGGSYHGPLLADYKPAPPAPWYNGGKGNVELDCQSSSAKLRAQTGSYKLAAGESITYEFSVLLTPVKPLDTKHHFSQRYFHAFPEKFNEAGAEGANIANIHHSRSLNPVINYPFIVQEPLKKFIKQQHAQDRKVKLYYTIRELSNYTAEIHALMSLNGEIFADGRGYGTPWHMEHLVEGYRPAWYTELPNDEADAALVLSSFSRWINYYLEGMRWMFQNYEIDGIYMDDVSFDRNVMKRMRKIMAQYRPEALVDLHSNTNYSKGAMNQYTDFFPYVDRLWFGEHFKYADMDADEWFVTFSGIPMGVMSEMLQDGGNRYLGMVYGTTGRHSYSKYNPAPIWALWKSFGIAEAEMIGYWSENPAVHTGQEDIKATAFVKKGEKTLIALGNFSHEEHSCQLSIDWEALGLDAATTRVHMPAIEDFQAAKELNISNSISITGQEGIILLLENETRK